jgi:hypothetical protein
MVLWIDSDIFTTFCIVAFQGKNVSTQVFVPHFFEIIIADWHVQFRFVFVKQIDLKKRQKRPKCRSVHIKTKTLPTIYALQIVAETVLYTGFNFLDIIILACIFVCCCVVEQLSTIWQDSNVCCMVSTQVPQQTLVWCFFAWTNHTPFFGKCYIALRKLYNIYICMYVCTYVCMYVCMYVCNVCM